MLLSADSIQPMPASGRRRIGWAGPCLGGLSLALVMLCGCGGDDDPTLPISGTVKLNGEPVAHGDIEFAAKQPNGLRRGAMIVNGQYKTAPREGLVPGEYIVRIFSVPNQSTPADQQIMPGEEDLGAPSARDMIPPEYNMRSKQTITVTAEGPNVFDYDIQSKKG